MSHKISYIQVPSTAIYGPQKVGIIQFLWRWIRNILAIFGLLLLASVFFLYFQGQQLAESFNEEFIPFFGKFVEQVMQKDVASAMLIKIPLEKGVTIEQATHAMKQYAYQLNLKLISSHPLHKQIQATTGKPSRFVEIFEFCDAAVSASLLKHNPDFAAYLPCRIALYEDNSGQFWFATLDMKLLLHGIHGIDPFVQVQALKVQESLLKIMGAGAHGAGNSDL
jgi:uncharacterized protein (DUF302 family)